MQHLLQWAGSACRDLLTGGSLLQVQLIQIPPKHLSDNGDGTSALQTAETFSPQICVVGLQGISLPDNLGSYRETKPGGGCASSNAFSYICFLIC